jgi:hypothetical protein
MLERNWDRLAAALRTRSVDYLASSDAWAEPLDDETLIASLAAHSQPRLVQSLIALLLIHPELAPQVPLLRAGLAPAAQVELLAHYMAAVYLQSMWRIRLDHYLPPTPDLPDYFSTELGLPDALDLYGEAGLYALAKWHSAHAAGQANHLSEYQSVAQLLLAAVELKARHVAPGGGTYHWPVVSRARIDVFLRRVAQDIRQPIKLYLVGGASYVYAGFLQQTLDIDFALEVTASDRIPLIKTLREISYQLEFVLDEVSPADFIVLPVGHEKRHESIGRLGQLEVFHYDWYSTALSKTMRGQRQDFADVVTVLKSQRVVWARLESMCLEVLPFLGRHRLDQDPKDFALNFQALQALWHSAGGTL